MKRRGQGAATANISLLSSILVETAEVTVGNVKSGNRMLLLILLVSFMVKEWLRIIESCFICYPSPNADCGCVCFVRYNIAVSQHLVTPVEACRRRSNLTELAVNVYHMNMSCSPVRTC